MELLHSEKLPQSSMARHVLVHTVGQLPPDTVLTTMISGEASQASLATGTPQTGVAGQATYWTGGQLMTGGVMSRTVMLLLQLALLPQASVARQVRVHTVGQLPDQVVLTTTGVMAPEQASLATAVPQDGVAGQSMVCEAGQEIVGGVKSRTVIVLLQEAVFPQSSYARHVRVQTVGQVPEETVLSMEIVRLSEQASVAVATPQTIVAGQSIVWLGGQLIDGGVMSRTVMVLVQAAVPPQTSVARQVRVHTVGHVPVDTVDSTLTETLGSFATAVPQAGVAGQSMVTDAGQAIAAAG
jgi:hypothetical protein